MHINSFSPLWTLYLEHLLPNSKQALLHILLPNAAILNVDQTNVFLLRLEEMKNRQTGANVVVRLISKGYQCAHISPEILLASDFQ